MTLLIKTFSPGINPLICQTVRHWFDRLSDWLNNIWIPSDNWRSSFEVWLACGLARPKARKNGMSAAHHQSKLHAVCFELLECLAYWCCPNLCTGPQTMSLHLFMSDLKHGASSSWIHVPLTTETRSQWCKCLGVCLSSSTVTRVFLLIGELWALSALP